MNIRLLAGAAAIGRRRAGLWRLSAAAAGPALTRSEVIGELDGPPLAAACARRPYRYGERQLLVGTMSKASWDPAGLARSRCWTAMNLVCRRSRAGSAPRWRRQARPAGQGKAGAPDPAVSAFAASGRAAWSIAATAPGFHAARLDRRRRRRQPSRHAARPHLVLVTEALHRSGPDQPQAAGGVFRSEDQGLRWSYDAQVALARERRALFLSETRAVALEPREGDERLLYTEDGARRWQAATIMEQVWPDAGAYGKAFDAQAEKRTRGSAG